MRIQLQLSLIVALSSTSLAQMVPGDSYSVLTAPLVSISELSAAYSAEGLTLKECTDRLERLGVLLQSRGLKRYKDVRFDDEATVTRWYDHGTDSTVVAWMRPSGGAHELKINVYAWNVRWNELLIP
ncbi:hypothetical protein HLB42_07700 [Deinococcus sp. D7000]|nr:hypothetical protein HLB42_07700 [Deinococcus sp. D7000]